MATTSMAGLIMDPSGNFHYAAVVDEALVTAAKAGGLTTDDKNIIFPAKAAFSRRWNIELYDIVVTLKPEVKAQLGVRSDNGINGATQGRIPVFSQIAGIPVNVDTETYYTGIPAEAKVRYMKQDLLKMVKFCGFSAGNYNDVEGYSKSAVHTGFPVTIRGRVTTNLTLVGNKWIPPMTRLCLAVPDVPAGPSRINNPYEQVGNRVRFTATPYEPTSTVDNMGSCLAKYTASEKASKNLKETNATGREMREKLRKDRVIKNDLKIAHRYRDHLKGLILLMVENGDVQLNKNSSPTDQELDEKSLTLMTRMIELNVNRDALSKRTDISEDWEQKYVSLRNMAFSEGIEAYSMAFTSSTQFIGTTLGVEPIRGEGALSSQNVDLDVGVQ